MNKMGSCSEITDTDIICHPLTPSDISDFNPAKYWFMLLWDNHLYNGIVGLYTNNSGTTISWVFHIIPMLTAKITPKTPEPVSWRWNTWDLGHPRGSRKGLDWCAATAIFHGIEPMSNQCLTNVPNIQSVPGRKIETPHDESNSKFLIVKPIEDLQAIDGHSIDFRVRSMGILWLDWLDTQGPKQPSCDFTQPAHEAWERTQQTRASPTNRNTAMLKRDMWHN